VFQAVVELSLALKSAENRVSPDLITVPKDPAPVKSVTPTPVDMLSLTISYHDRSVKVSMPSSSTVRDLRRTIISNMPGCGTATLSDILMALSNSDSIADCFPGNDLKIVDEGISDGTTVFVEFKQHSTTSEVTSFSACDFSTLFSSRTPFWYALLRLLWGFRPMVVELFGVIVGDSALLSVVVTPPLSCQATE
jgi:hypothetical protein